MPSNKPKPTAPPRTQGKAKRWLVWAGFAPTAALLAAVALGWSSSEPPVPHNLNQLQPMVASAGASRRADGVAAVSIEPAEWELGSGAGDGLESLRERLSSLPALPASELTVEALSLDPAALRCPAQGSVYAGSAGWLCVRPAPPRASWPRESFGFSAEEVARAAAEGQLG